VIVNPEGGLIAVRATARQHEKIAQFLDVVLGAAKRQVLIEATIIEVKLSNAYQQGINWSNLAGGGLKLTQGAVGSLPSGVTVGTTPGIFVINYLNPTSRLGNLATTIQLLESFGKVKVLSSPKISVLNNQTALLKVVDNNVFFSIKVTPAILNANGVPTTPATYESHLETVPVGFVMSVTPQISDSDEVTLNVRPTITRVVGKVKDPNPALATANVTSEVPVIQARELESIMKVNSGQIAVMGGLMQDSVDNAKDSVPVLGRIPVLGDLFSYRNENTTKTELVIFMRPVVVKDASINGDYKDYRYILPGQTPDTEPYPFRQGEWIMSLLMQALKKAERAKQNAPDDELDKPSEAFDEILALTPEPAQPAAAPAPKREFNLDALSLEPMAGDAPAPPVAASSEPRRRRARCQPPATTRSRA
jgi:general secretion pathway protein D